MDQTTLLKIKEALDELFEDRPMPTPEDLDFNINNIILYAELRTVWDIFKYMRY